MKILMKICFILTLSFLATHLVNAQALVINDSVREYLQAIPFYNPCNDENVLADGWNQHSFHATFNENRARVKIEVKSHFEGIGEDSGDLYIANGVFRVMWNESLVGDTVGTSVGIRLTFVSQGDAPNFTDQRTEHIQVNANGQLTTDLVNQKSECNL